MSTDFGIKLCTLYLSSEVVLEVWIVSTNVSDILFCYRETFISILFNSTGLLSQLSENKIKPFLLNTEMNWLWCSLDTRT